MELSNDVASLVILGSAAPEVEETLPLINGLLYALIDIYESLRQCEENGYVAQQTSHK